MFRRASVLGLLLWQFQYAPLSQSFIIGHGSCIRPKQLVSVLSNSSRKNDNGAEELQRKAEALKAEVKLFEDAKEQASTKAQKEKQAVEDEKLEKDLRYSAEVPILKNDGSEVMERVFFKPFCVDSIISKIVVFQASLPLGMILSEHETIPGAVEVSEVSPDGNAGTAGIKVGSLLRAVTACQVTMEQPTWQLMMGGIGQPKTTRMMYSTDNKPFEEVMEAIASNRALQTNIWLVLEVQQ